MRWALGSRVAADSCAQPCLLIAPRSHGERPPEALRSTSRTWLRISLIPITCFGPSRLVVSLHVDHPVRSMSIRGVAGLVCGRVGGIGCGEAAEGAAEEGDPVGVVHQPVEDGIAKRGVPDARVPVFDGQLTGDKRGPPAGAILHQFQEIAPFPVAGGGPAPSRPG